MAGLTLKQSADLSQDVLQTGVIETMATESKLLSILPFMTVEGNGYSYNVEQSLADVSFRGLGEGYDTVGGAKEKRTEFLTILGGEAVIDRFQIEVHGNMNDLMAIEVALTSKAIAHKFEKTFLNGDSSVDANAFDGLLVRYAGKANEMAGTADIQADIDVLLDSVQGGADALIMSKATRRELTSVARSYVTYRTNEFGVQVTQFGGIDVVDIDPELIDDGVIIAVRFGVKEAVAGLQSKSGLTARPLGELDTAPQLLTRIEWYVGLAVFNDKTVAIRKAPVTP